MLSQLILACSIGTAISVGAGPPSQVEAAAGQSESTRVAMNASLELQKASVRRQRAASAGSTAVPATDAGGPSFFVIENLQPEPADTPECDPLSPLEVQSLVERAAQASGLKPDFVRAVMKSESGFRPCAISPAGALGLMQLMPATASELDVSDPLDPEQNVFAGAKLLRRLMDRFSGDLNRTLGAYNAGPANVVKYNGVPDFPETLTYVDKTMKEFLSHTTAGEN